MEHRVRMDVPTLSDPVVRDLLQESDLFARSFSGGGFGILSPLDFVHILSLLTEIASHLFLIISLIRGPSHIGVLLLSVFSVALPLVATWFSFSPMHSESPSSARETRAADRQERMRNLAYSDMYRPEIALFGLEDWILKSWSSARKIIAATEQHPYLRKTSVISHFNLSELVYALQNVCLVYFLLTLTNFDTDSTAFASADVICLPWVIDCLPQFNSVFAIRLWEFDHYDKNGISGDFSDVRVLREYEVEAPASTEGRGHSEIYFCSRWGKH